MGGMAKRTSRISSQHCEQQKAALAAFGRYALTAHNYEDMLHKACVGAADGLGIARAKILRPTDGRDRLLVCAGIGWNPGVVGSTVIDGDMGSPAGYALMSGLPVVSTDIAREARFRIPELLADHGIRSMVNVVITCDGTPYGVLEVDHARPRRFTDDDINFLTGYANLLGAAIQRLHHVGELHALAEQRTVLLQELHHRVRNNIQVISSIVIAQSAQSHDQRVRQHLQSIASRIQALRLVHEKLHGDGSHDSLDFGDYLGELCSSLFSFHGESADRIHLDLRLDALRLDPNTALPLGLVVNEFVTNSLKYAFPQNSEGTVSVTLQRLEGERARLILADNGIGFGKGESAGTGIGMQLIPMLAAQAHAALEWGDGPGSRLTLTFLGQ